MCINPYYWSLFGGPIGKITETGLWPIGPPNKKIQPVVEKKNSTWGWSYKRQASSFKKIQPVVVWITLRKILTMVQGSCRMSILTNTGEINDKRNRTIRRAGSQKNL